MARCSARARLRLLERCIALDPELGAHIDGSVGRHAFVSYFIENRLGHATAVGLWKGFVMEQVSRAVSSWSGHSTSVTPPIGDKRPDGVRSPIPV